MANVCTRCNVTLGTFTTPYSSGRHSNLCFNCFNELELNVEAKRIQEAKNQRLKLLKNVIVTTTPGVDGYRVMEYLGIESVEFVIGTGVFSEVSSSIADFFGARSSAFEKKLREAKQHSMEALKFLAVEKGANAVVAVDLDYTEFSGNRIALIINGTLVRIEPIGEA